MQHPKYLLVERFADNGQHSHWDLIDSKTQHTVWSEDGPIDIDELWDDHSEYIDDDIDSLSNFAGKTVITGTKFKALMNLIVFPGLTRSQTPPPSSHQGNFIRDMEAEVSKRYSDPESEFAQDFEIGASWAKEYLSQPAPPTPVEGNKDFMTELEKETEKQNHGYSNPEYIKKFNDGAWWAWNFYRAYEYGLNSVISHLEEQVKELQGRKGLRWILAEKDNLPQGRYADFQWRYADTKAPILISQFYPADYGKYEYLSDSPAPEQVDADSMLSDAIKKAKAFSESIPDGEDKQLAHHAFMLGYAANVNGPKYLEMKNALQTAYDCMEWMWANMTLDDGRKHLQSDAFNIPANAISIAQDALGISGKPLLGD